MSWWNTLPQRLDPTAITIMGFEVRWYGLMYLVAFFLGYHLVWHFVNKYKVMPMKKEQLESVVTWLIAGVLLGARLGYVFFYEFGYYIKHPLEIILPFSFKGGFHFTGISGMSYHGGLIGAFLLTSYAIKKQKLDYWKSVNILFLFVPLVYTFGRLGNFINGELYGTTTQSAIGMLFPLAKDNPSVLRHPSQLYEMCFEGFILFGFLYVLWKIFPKIRDHIMALYLIGYGVARYFIEFFREPTHADILWMTRGQALCAVMILSGIALWAWRAYLLYSSYARRAR
ncbi:MAG: prolipoprotein diacylglyceryl transferase [Fibromonadaceae bacterium]|jgi:phosphatidylglycerol:prolipoprotein diacylglycerol transferase|nr:prolipoprotein diacylglyceryl transferase [Fibromonadaceae bacterium]